MTVVGDVIRPANAAILNERNIVPSSHNRNLLY